MGFSLSAATAIIGVGIFLSAQYIVSDVIPSVTDTHDSFQSMKNRAIDHIQSDIEIIDVNSTDIGPLYNLSIYVKNNGSTTLEIKYFDMLFNGIVQDFSFNSNYLYPDKTVILTLNNKTNTGRLKIITDNGISDYYEYNI